jgi:hypothetical protein
VPPPTRSTGASANGADLFEQPGSVAAAEVEAQHAELVAVLRSFHGGRSAATLLGPLLDDLVVRRGEGCGRDAPGPLGRGDLLRVQPA